MNGNLSGFVDTNVLVYAVSKDEPEKQQRARAIVARGFADGCYAISTQVLMELYVTITRKAKVRLSPREAFEYVRSLADWPVVDMTSSLVLTALELAERAGISPWDAAILETARQAGCSTVLSEDLADGRDYFGVTVRNPFAS